MNLVSAVINTKNEERNIGKLLDSLKKQSYKSLEIIVVDNFSSDRTQEIAKSYGARVYTQGPERSVQKNYGVYVSLGEYILLLDADMILSTDVVSNCVEKINSDPQAVGIIIPEISIGEGYWAECRILEKSFYINDDLIEAARFFKKKVLIDIGCYDTNLVSGEDWDLSNTAKSVGKILRVSSPIYHNDGKVNFIRSLKKKFYYGKKIPAYVSKHVSTSAGVPQLNIINRYKIFFSDPKKLFARPHIGIGLLFFKFCEFCAVGLGMFFTRPLGAIKLFFSNLVGL